MSSLHKDVPKASLDDILKTHSIINEEIVEGIKVVYVIPLKKKREKMSEEEKEKAKKETQKRYYDKNKDKINSNVAKWRKKKIDTDEEFKLRAIEATKRHKEKKKKEEEEKEDIE
jgi:hypothetical protein